jgi:hypothetical protein
MWRSVSMAGGRIGRSRYGSALARIPHQLCAYIPTVHKEHYRNCRRSCRKCGLYGSLQVLMSCGMLRHTAPPFRVVHSKDNRPCPSKICGSLWPPRRAAFTCSCTAADNRSLFAMIHGAYLTTCLAGRMRCRISRFTTVLLTCSSRAASSCVTQSSWF